MCTGKSPSAVRVSTREVPLKDNDSGTVLSERPQQGKSSVSPLRQPSQAERPVVGSKDVQQADPDGVFEGHRGMRECVDADMIAGDRQLEQKDIGSRLSSGVYSPPMPKPTDRGYAFVSISIPQLKPICLELRWG